MLKNVLVLMLGLAWAFSSAQAEPCVKLRNGNDGLSCMKFDAQERSKAAAYGLRLGTPFAKVKRHLLKSGWSVDRKWIEENSTASPTKEGLVCGSGWDAVCSTAFRKGQQTISLVMSGTNEGFPLISVDLEPAQ